MVIKETNWHEPGVFSLNYHGRLWLISILYRVQFVVDTNTVSLEKKGFYLHNVIAGMAGKEVVDLRRKERTVRIHVFIGAGI